MLHSTLTNPNFAQVGHDQKKMGSSMLGDKGERDGGQDEEERETIMPIAQYLEYVVDACVVVRGNNSDEQSVP